MTDALSDLLSFLEIRGARCTRFEAGGKWAFRFPAKPALKFAAVLRGECWIMLPGRNPQRLTAGDTFLLAEAPQYVLANDPQLEPQDGLASFDWEHSDIARHGGSETALLAGSFVFEALHVRLLLDALPEFMLIPAADGTAPLLRGLLEILDREIHSGQMGVSFVTRRLAEVLLVQVLRGYGTRYGNDEASWVGAAADPRIGAALNLMHADVARRWTVDELARAAGMSRSAFAVAFKHRVGTPPLDYLLRWRMQVARSGLLRGETIAAVAAKVGYASASAFGNAFKRIHGTPPKRYGSADRSMPRDGPEPAGATGELKPEMVERRI
ncbi:AraC family transcriptional regulator [Bradyrhizobium liaoningense]|uniref:AraC family transcriptional regulator n=1 Tax=Bradyrhizobium liaoningense TaxID=43992 RepID=UPI001BAB6AF9|nr:AraC family transcriptional regulator [Bradyrhizobium liaoningense]MBR0711381.1 AraC family transcriptional regulator [Bradyrhizobium liaoningense]